uniref:Spidroin-1-like n=1 Tax=Crassostrea virginica TaxID=6565 RepID=A0A8B8E449_CRAVI|nr:spidroin-1-like [Crassostrea virginica]XP_022334985.1 spidroin-1-like [Crassostrea virginica]WBW88627.1 polyalanine-containing protein A1 [Crassostrea virginica]
MIVAVSFLCFIAGSLAIPVPTDYYPKTGCGQYGCSNGHGAHGINGGLIGINSNGFESNMLGFEGGNSAAAASAAASGLGSAAAAAAAAASGQQGIFGLNNGFNSEFGFNGGNSAAAASAAASGMNAAAAAAAAAAAGSSGHGPFVGYQGATGQQLIGSYNGIIGPQGPYVQYQGVQQFGGFDGSAAASAAAAASQQGAAAAAAAAAGRNAAAAAAAAAGRNAAAAAAAAASDAGMGSQFGFGGLTGSQFNGQIGGPYVQPSGYFPGVPVFGQNSGAAAAASAAASNNAAAAAAAAAASGSNGFINGGFVGGSSSIIGPQVVPGRKVY